MRRDMRSQRLRLVTVWLCVLLTWTWAVIPAKSYAPIDNLVALVTLLSQSGEGFDVMVADDLSEKLKTAGTLIDSGDNMAAAELLNALTQDINRWNSTVMTNSSATQLVNEITKIVAGL